jgi:hypothetical protein
VEPDDAPSGPPTQQQARREPDVVGTTGRAVTRLVDKPPAARSPVVEDEPAIPSEPEPRAVTLPVSAPLPAAAKTVEAAPRPAPVEVGHLEPAPAERASLAAPPEPDQRQLVRDLLQRYVVAFERLDVDAAKAVWPTVDGDALRRAFSQLEAQHLRFETCGITIAGSGANARCRGQATFHPRIGSRPLHLSAREWNFELARAESGWQIVDARVR